MSSTKKLGGLLWFNIILFGFIGQVAWAVENIYFNTFLFDKIGATHEKISLMVSASAVTAMVTTLIMGALSDKLNRRKLFLSGGYIIWGLSVCVFAFISRESIGRLFGLTDTVAIVAATVSVVIIMDCVMTFFGSTSNDAAFNAWVTDVTDVSNRGSVESVLALMSVFATVIVSVVFGLLVDVAGYSACFIGLGLLVTACGVLGLFTVRDSLSGEKKQESYWKDLTYGFRPSVIKENRSLYISLAATGVFTTAVQVFMPYIFIYLEHYLKFSFDNLHITPVAAIVAVAAVGLLVTGMVMLGKMIDKLGKSRFAMLSVALFVVGLVSLSLARRLGVFGLCALMMFAGYGLLTIILNASIRDFTPEGMAGRFQGIRMIFMVLIPMVIGPAVGSRVISAFSSTTYMNEYHELVKIPVPHIYAAAAIIGVFVLIPLFFVRKDFKSVNFN